MLQSTQRQVVTKLWLVYRWKKWNGQLVCGLYQHKMLKMCGFFSLSSSYTLVCFAGAGVFHLIPTVEINVRKLVSTWVLVLLQSLCIQEYCLAIKWWLRKSLNRAQDRLRNEKDFPRRPLDEGTVTPWASRQFMAAQFYYYCHLGCFLQHEGFISRFSSCQGSRGSWPEPHGIRKLD